MGRDNYKPPWEPLFLSLFCVFFPLAVVSDIVSLHPSETIGAPLRSTVFINCSFNLDSQDTDVYWNISGEILRLSPSADRGITIDTPSALNGVSRLSLFLNDANLDLDVQCQLCRCNSDSPAQDFTASTDPLQVIGFGPPSLLSHELMEKDNVKLLWLHRLVALFTYNIIIMESTNNSPVTNINITNNTYVIISTANITGYNECTSYQWGVRAAANISYGFTDFRNASESFTFTAAPNITDAMVTSNIPSIIFELEFSSPAEDIYTYNLHQKDYCGDQLNSSEINNTLISRINDTMVSINIQSLIHNVSWSVSVEVSGCQYNDTTQYINITNGNDADIVSLFHSFPYISTSSLCSPTFSLTSNGESGSWTSTNTIIVIAAVIGGGTVAMLCICIGIYVVFKVKNNRKSFDFNNDVDEVNDFKCCIMTFLNRTNDTSMVIEPLRIRVDSSVDIVNEDYSNLETLFQTHQDPLPPAPNDAEGTPDSELATHQYADLDR